jgi:hypothetical protein
MHKWLLLLFLFTTSVLSAQSKQMDTVVIRKETVESEEPVAAPEESTVTVETQTEESEKKNYLSPTTPEDKIPVSLRSVPKRRLDSLRRADDFWYWKYRPEAEKEERPGLLARLFATGIMRYIFWAIIGIGCAALVYFFLLSLNINPFRRRQDTAEEEESSDPEADFFNRDYEGEIARALAAGDHRIAIRLRYLQLLKELADRNIIQYRHERPNGVYVSQLLGTSFYPEFFRITRTFEYAWYGEMAVTRAAYEYMQSDIAHLKSRFA